ncbi:hypothetical protein [Oceanobacillus oncorhynchi]|uniref:hypothetical protein n=1 Tax=Oceanobacillus oncorhynchi TaxID=545501 RepID=UPI0034D48CB8
MEKYLWDIHLQTDTFVGTRSVKVASDEQSLVSINKAFSIALKETRYGDSECIKIIKVEYLGEIYV